MDMSGCLKIYELTSLNYLKIYKTSFNWFLHNIYVKNRVYTA